jgi:hypothetical protein
MCSTGWVPGNNLRVEGGAASPFATTHLHKHAQHDSRVHVPGDEADENNGQEQADPDDDGTQGQVLPDKGLLVALAQRLAGARLQVGAEQRRGASVHGQHNSTQRYDQATAGSQHSKANTQVIERWDKHGRSHFTHTHARVPRRGCLPSACQCS